jgi:hypothetical protein
MNHTYIGIKAFLKDHKLGLVVKKIWSIFLLRDPDPGEPYQCGSMRIRIHNTEKGEKSMGILDGNSPTPQNQICFLKTEKTR